MKWTTERPTVEGLYWIEEAGRPPEPVEIARQPWGLCVQYIGDERSHELAEAWADSVRWYGPIVAPANDSAVLTGDQISRILDIWERYPGLEFVDQLRALGA
ncbi:hypothetical protein [Burkholderia vietnamiensis]|uniref:hypothetical protein n=1 Tax=Burkholderia vietnamiensis TaxID=60552 RepID=UPI000B04E183|nr:hypothetical protein [Burkholderia vietnamiensis]